MNYKIVASSFLVVAFFAFLIIAYVKYSSRNIESEKIEISQSILNAIKNDPELRQNASSKADVGTLNKEQIEQIVKEIIANDPAVIANALDKIAATKIAQEKEAMKNKIKSLSDNIYNNKNDPQIGSTNPKIKIIEFFDYFCGYCRKMHEVNSSIIAANPDVALIFKELPILSEGSIEASKFSLAINIIDPVRYAAFQKALLSENVTSSDDIIAIAKKVGVDIDKLNSFLKDEKNTSKINAQIQDNMKIAADIGVRGTPTYIISEIDEVIAGASTVENMQQLIDKIKQFQAGNGSDSAIINNIKEDVSNNSTKTNDLPPAVQQSATENKDQLQIPEKSVVAPALPQNNVVTSPENSADPKMGDIIPNIIESAPPVPGLNVQEPSVLPKPTPLPPTPPMLPNPTEQSDLSNKPMDSLAPPPLPPISNR